MTTVNSSSSASTSAADSQKTASKTIANNFDQFLQLLTTQLQNQNPLDPLDTNQFTQQLVQFSSVEQQLKTNDLLTTLVSTNTSNMVSAAAGYLGAQITADGSQSPLVDNSAKWSWNAPRGAAQATISVLDESGATVYTKRGPIDAGPGSLDWNGRGDDGSLYTSGTYTIKIDALDASGQPVTISTEVSGKVDSVDLSGSTPILKVGGISVPLDKVKTLSKS